jgi:hypothetical protein
MSRTIHLAGNLDELKDVLNRERMRKRVSEAEGNTLCSLIAREAIMEKPAVGTMRPRSSPTP